MSERFSADLSSRTDSFIYTGLLLYWKSVMDMLNVGSEGNTRLNLKTLSVIFLIVVSFILIDVVIGSLVDIYFDFSTSPAGISLFVAATGVLYFGTYVILKITENKFRGQSIRRTYENKIAKVVWIIYYLMIVITAFVIFQLFFFSEYYTGLLSIAPTVSYGLVAFLLGLLAYRFFSWFARIRALVVLLYGLASVSASIYVVLVAVIFYGEIFIHQPVVTTLESSANFPDITSRLEEFLIVTLAGILIATTLLSFWGD